MDFPKINKIKGFDENENEVIVFNDVELLNMEVEEEIVKLINCYGITSAQLIKNIQILCTFGVSSFELTAPGPVSDAQTENPNQNIDLEIFDQNVFDDNYIILNSDIV